MDNTPVQQLPPSVERVLGRFERLNREEKMQALVHYSRKLEPLPERYRDLDRTEFTVPECQTRVDIFPEQTNGRMHFYADVDVKHSPTIAAFLAILFSAVNDEPPETTIAIPDDFVRRLMQGIGLAGREFGLTSILGRVKRYARQAAA